MPENQEQPQDPVAKAEARERNARAAKDEAEAKERKAKAAKDEAEAKERKAKAAKDEAEAKERKAKAAKDEAEARERDARAAKDEAQAREHNAKAAKDEAEARERDAKAAKDKAEAKRLKIDSKRSKLENDKFKAETKKIKLDVKRAEAARDLIEGHQQRLQERHEKNGEQPKSVWGIRDFVRDSLLDIMGGVDDAAAKGQTRALKDRLDDYLPSVTAIGAVSSGEPQAERVEFDIAVTVVHDERQEASKGGQVNAGLKIALPISSALLSLGAGGSRHWDSTQASSNSSEQANRIRFSVPIIYATQDESPDDD